MSEPSSSDYEEEDRGRTCHLPTPGQIRDRARASRQAARAERQRRDSVGTSSHTTDAWRASDHGNLVHQGLCDVYRVYTLHVYENMLDHNPHFLM
jgi:hypothetical protein